jgi:proteic killer suppression protein
MCEFLDKAGNEQIKALFNKWKVQVEDDESYHLSDVDNQEKSKLKYFSGKKTRLVPPDIVKRAIMRLDRIDAATCIDDLRFPPSHHLEKLSGNRDGQWSIRINDQWRVCFLFENGIDHNVEIVEYH